MKKMIFIILIVFFCLISCSFAGESFSNLKDSIIYALKNNPDIKSYGAKADTYFAGIGIARADYRPQLTSSDTYVKTKSQAVPTYETYSYGLTLTQLIYDFDKTNLNININKESYNQSLCDLYNKVQDISLNLIQSYNNVLMNQHLIKAYNTNVDRMNKTYLQAKKFFEVGTKSKIDVTTAYVNLSNAKLDYIKAENDLRVSFQNFYNALGVKEEKPITLKDIQTTYDFKAEPEDIVNVAYKIRRDILKLKSQIEAQNMQTKYNVAGYFPSISGNTGYLWTGTLNPLPRAWNSGVSVTWSIFTGGKTNWQVQQSRDKLKDLEFQMESLRNNVRTEVYTKYSDVIKLLESIYVTDDALKQAVENEELASERYRVGLGNIIELTGAQSDRITAEANYVKAIYQYNSAKAQLDKSTGLDLAQIYAR